MCKLTLGTACIDAGGVYVNLLAHCEKICIIGKLRERAQEIDELEFAVIAKPSLVGYLKEQFTVLSDNQHEIVFLFNKTQVSVMKCNKFNFVCAKEQAA